MQMDHLQPPPAWEKIKEKRYRSTSHLRIVSNSILEQFIIEKRPKSVEERLTLGHWEGDTIIGKNHKGAMITNVERKSGFLLGKKSSIELPKRL